MSGIGQFSAGDAWCEPTNGLASLSRKRVDADLGAEVGRTLLEEIVEWNAGRVRNPDVSLEVPNDPGGINEFRRPEIGHHPPTRRGELIPGAGHCGLCELEQRIAVSNATP